MMILSKKIVSKFNARSVKKEKKKKLRKAVLPFKCGLPCHKTEMSISCSVYPASWCHDLKTTCVTESVKEAQNEFVLLCLTIYPACVIFFCLNVCI